MGTDLCMAQWLTLRYGAIHKSHEQVRGWGGGFGQKIISDLKGGGKISRITKQGKYLQNIFPFYTRNAQQGFSGYFLRKFSLINNVIV